MYLITIDAVSISFCTFSMKIIATKEQLNDIVKLADVDRLKDAIELFINTGKVVEYFYDEPLLEPIQYIKDKSISGEYTEFTYINMFESNYDFSFNKYKADAIYVKTNDGQYIKGTKLYVEDIVCKIKEKHRQAFIDKELRFYNAVGRGYGWKSSILHVIETSNKAFTKSKDDIHNKVCSLVYIVDKYFENEQEMEIDYLENSDINYEFFFEQLVGE